MAEGESPFPSGPTLDKTLKSQEQFFVQDESFGFKNSNRKFFLELPMIQEQLKNFRFPFCSCILQHVDRSCPLENLIADVFATQLFSKNLENF